MIEKEASLNLLSFPTFPDGLTIVAVPNISNGLVVFAYPKDLDEFFVSSWVKEDASSIPTPPPIAEKIKIVDLRNDKTIPAMLALWLGGQKPLDRYTQYTGQRMEQVMFEAGKHYRTQNGSKVRYSSTDGMICVFEVVVGCGEWHEGDVFYTQLNGLSWVADGGLDIVAPWGEEGSK